MFIVVAPIFKLSKDVRKIIYTTNAIGSLNPSYRKLNCQRSVFPSGQVLLKALYPATFKATKKWTQAIITGARPTARCAYCTRAVCRTDIMSQKTIQFLMGKLDLNFLSHEQKSRKCYIRNINSSFQPFIHFF